ncbi:zinc finger, RING/FYVE/PHD-type containing protein [Tanacetum coccineum]
MDVVGGTIGAVGGALIGFKNKMNFLQNVIEGAVSGANLSHKITRLTFDQFLQSDHVDEHDYFLHLIDIVAGDLESKLLRDQDYVFLITKVASCEKLIKLPKIEISEHDLYEASGNATCCSICLQDFAVGDAAGIFPKCEHKFHPQLLACFVWQVKLPEGNHSLTVAPSLSISD